MLEIDGAQGEGGGQVLRTALALSLLTGRGFRLHSVRAGRQKPGLMRQHLACVQAAQAIGQATVTGDFLHSTELTFQPQAVQAGDYHFAIGSAGSTMLVLQTILPVLLLADRPSTVVIEGGTHNPMAPTADFVQQGFLPLLQRLGAAVELQVAQAGFAPVGGGRVRVQIQPWHRMQSLDLLARGPVQQVSLQTAVLNLEAQIAEREREVLQAQLQDWPLGLAPVGQWLGVAQGNALSVRVQLAAHTEVFTALGERGRPAEQVARRLAGQVQRYLHQGAALDEYSTDQALLPLALVAWKTGQTSRFSSRFLSQHTHTQAEGIERFLPVSIGFETVERMAVVTVRPRA